MAMVYMAQIQNTRPVHLSSLHPLGCIFFPWIASHSGSMPSPVKQS